MVIMMNILIEEAAKALFFQDMVDGIMDVKYRDVWQFDTEPNASTGDKIRAHYIEKAKTHLRFTGAL